MNYYSFDFDRGSSSEVLKNGVEIGSGWTEAVFIFSALCGLISSVVTILYIVKRDDHLNYTINGGHGLVDDSRAE